VEAQAFDVVHGNQRWQFNRETGELTPVVA
jgi:hypothetical protein